MTKKDDSANDSTKTAAEAQSAALAGQAPGQRSAPTGTQATGTGSYQIGDRVLIEAEVKAVSGDQLSLAVDREPAHEGVAPASTEGTTLTLRASQVRKA